MTSWLQSILTAAEMRAQEDRAIAAGVPALQLMERAGAAAARAAGICLGRMPTLVLAGPGNNGGDGYTVARHLAAAGWPVEVAAAGPPATDASRAMAERWKATGGRTVPLAEARPRSLLVDALFGTGLRRGLAPALVEGLHSLRSRARAVLAVDLPSGVETDSGRCLSAPLTAELTVSFGALKPAHLLLPAAAHCGRLVVADIGLGAAESRLFEVRQPDLPGLPAEAHKFARGAVLVLSGPAAAGGAARLAARAALRAGAGIVILLAPTPALTEHAARLDAVMVRALDSPHDLHQRAADERVRCIVAGPGLGQDPHARGLAEAALASGRPLVLDGDIFTLFRDAPESLFRGLTAPAVLTPHEGEFRRLFPDLLSGSKVDRVRAAAARAGAVVLLKGKDSVIAAPDGRAAIASRGTPDLATAGSGDVLAGVVAALLGSMAPFEAACGAAWLHGEAGRRLGPGLIAEDLPEALPAVLAACRPRSPAPAIRPT